MSERNRDYYLRLRRRYEPANAKLIIVAESPPASGKYFYDPAGSTKEPLFSAIMKQIGQSPPTKESGLRDLQQKGWLLIDATYQSVDKLVKGTRHTRDEIIARDYSLLLEDLQALTPDRSVPLVLIKSNVCRALNPLLSSDGFNVVNRGETICFPSNGWQNQFKEQFAAVLCELAP